MERSSGGKEQVGLQPALCMRHFESEVWRGREARGGVGEG